MQSLAVLGQIVIYPFCAAADIFNAAEAAPEPERFIFDQDFNIAFAVGIGYIYICNQMVYKSTKIC